MVRRLKLTALAPVAILLAVLYVALATPTMAKVFSGTWLSSTTGDLAPPPDGIEGYCLGINGNRIIMTHGDRASSGDSGDVSIYNIASNTWSAGTASPNPRAEGAGTSAANLTYCIGGRDGNSLVEAYNSQSDSWTTLAPLGVGRAGLSVASQGSKIFAIGGRFVGGGPCSDAPISPQAEVYDIRSNTWSFIADPPVLVTDAALVSQGGLLYLIGGCDASFTAVNNVQIYNPRTNSWTAGPSMPTARASLAAASVGGAIYAIAGLAGFVQPNLDVVEGLDVAHGTWFGPLTPKPTPSSEIEAVVRGDTIYIPGSGSYGVVADIFEAFQRH
jgi:hypothetical protein